ncbi:uncharacterized protein [Clytia hemisphaerica]|uniref:Uncharacterized protein n=2 Tax=Clytia hemisphaerica TaxID=252671 RepID=A0A7M5UKX9_9CNID
MERAIITTPAMHEKIVQKIGAEYAKKKFDLQTLISYIDQDYKFRRSFIAGLAKNKDHHVEVLKKYPCFQDHRMVIHEAFQVIEHERKIKKLTNCNTDRLEVEIDHLITWATLKLQMMPKDNKPATRLTFLLNNLPCIIGNKQKLSKKLVHDVAYSDKNRPNVQVLSNFDQIVMVYEEEKMKLFLRGKHLTTVSLVDAVPTMLAYYYLFDMDYPLNYDTGFHFLQYVIFGDSIVPKNLEKTLDNFNDAYSKFKIERLRQ